MLITHGAKQALFGAFSALLSRGDEVLVPAPYWVTFPSSVRLAGGTPAIVEPAPGTLKVTVDELEAARTPTTRVLLLCSPNNPTGLVHDETELAAILDWAVHRDLWLVADETYADLAIRPVPAPARVDPRIADRLVTIGGVSKSFAMTGWRVGWVAGPRRIVTAATAVQSHTTSNVAEVTQAAALAALTGEDVTAGFREVLARRRGLCKAVLGPLGLFDPEPEGAFYVFPDVSAYGTDVDVVSALIEQGVITVPGSSFGAPGRIRISYATGEDDLTAGLQIIARTLPRLRAGSSTGDQR
ncbi:aminotransferase class I/II-fold pyridoxal phosphate-dependent enzyme [Saccharopolyspora hattusasensis]|uniref:aminotransferase class I/II-fold pyridoxal phosphate-dependent enzyme n=1 Tax=Saccharopolyspora hattusasensis TaxID=1128679 RepID=UPI003D982959